MKFPLKNSVSSGLLLAFAIAGVIWLSGEDTEQTAVYFVEHTYSELYHENSSASSLEKADEIYSSTLKALIKKEQQRQIKSGEIGKLSADPLCNCQDPTAVQTVEIMPEFVKDGRATVMVMLSMSGTHEEIRLELIREAGHWKIDDVKGEQILSLQKSLTGN